MLRRALASSSLRSSVPFLSRGLANKVPEGTEVQYLVIDGYTQAGRADLEAGGATTAGVLYDHMLRKCTPGPAKCDIVYPADLDFSLPSAAELSKYDGVAWTGCSLTIFEDDPAVKEQIKFQERVYEAGVPSFGSCWALQVAAVAAGGKCALNPRGREMGFARKIQLTPEGRTHPMFEGKPAVFDAFTSHNDEVTHMPTGGLNLASNAWTAIQAGAIVHRGATFWGVQYHPEYDLQELARLTYCRIAKLVSLGILRDEESGRRYVEQLEALHADPSRHDIAWMLGIDSDTMEEDIRWCEVRNWVRKQVL